MAAGTMTGDTVNVAKSHPWLSDSLAQALDNKHIRHLSLLMGGVLLMICQAQRGESA